MHETKPGTIYLNPVEMTGGVMKMLEEKGLIYRLCPDSYLLHPEKGETLSRPLYECDVRYGPHMIISVAVNRTELSEFGTHPDTEDFLLIGDADTNPLYIVVALCKRDEFEKKILERKLTEEDFITLRAKYNDPEVSFFSMVKDVPHGEMIYDVGSKPASFFVTESRDLTTDITDFKGYGLSLDTGNK